MALIILTLFLAQASAALDEISSLQTKISLLTFLSPSARENLTELFKTMAASRRERIKLCNLELFTSPLKNSCTLFPSTKRVEPRFIKLVEQNRRALATCKREKIAELVELDRKQRAFLVACFGKHMKGFRSVSSLLSKLFSLGEKEKIIFNQTLSSKNCVESIY